MQDRHPVLPAVLEDHRIGLDGGLRRPRCSVSVKADPADAGLRILRRQPHADGSIETHFGEYRGNVAFFKLGRTEHSGLGAAMVTKTLTELGDTTHKSPALVSSICKATSQFKPASVRRPAEHLSRLVHRPGCSEYVGSGSCETHVKLFLETEIEKTLRVMNGKSRIPSRSSWPRPKTSFAEPKPICWSSRRQNIDGLPATSAGQLQPPVQPAAAKSSRVELELIRARAQQQIGSSESRCESSRQLIEAQRTSLLGPLPRRR